MTKPEPVYLSIQRYLTEKIRTGALRAGDKAPSENELASEFGVSRLTVQRAIAGLVSRGLVTRVRGSGTYISIAPWQFSLFEIREMAEEIRSRGGNPVRDVLKQVKQPASDDVAAVLEVEMGVELFHASVLELDGSTPMAIVNRWSVTDVFPDFLEQDFNQTTVFAYWASRTSLDEVDLTITAILPDADQRRLLSLGKNVPCVRLHRTNRVKGRVLTYTQITFAGDRLSLNSRYRPA